MSDEEFGWITDKPPWTAEDDLKWCANIALGMGGVLILAGVILGNYAETPMIKCYAITLALMFSALFFVIGGAIHWHVYQKIKRTTIKHLGRWGK